jgi:hypothetical protein
LISSVCQCVALSTTAELIRATAAGVLEAGDNSHLRFLSLETSYLPLFVNIITIINCQSSQRVSKN